MVVGEWAKIPTLHQGIGAFHHGFMELVETDGGAVVFAPPGCSAESAWALARDLEQYGVKVLVVVHGHLHAVQDQPSNQPVVNEFLSPILDIIPVQMAADTLAHNRGFGNGFRYMGKVVTKV